MVDRRSTQTTCRRDLVSSFLPYGRQCIDDSDVEAVVSALRSDWLTTGPAVDAFEQDLSKQTSASHCISFANGTAALHGAMHALALQPGDEVIVPAITFVASANAAVYCGAVPVFADVLQDTLLIDPKDVERKITSRTRCIVAVDYAGQPCDYDTLHVIAKKYNLHLVADACHSLGGSYKTKAVGSLADITAFSFHPVKPITTAEGGAATTNSEKLAVRLRAFRSHGIFSDFRQREKNATFEYSMETLGYNYRLSDLHCALGIAQLKKLSAFRIKRKDLAECYQTLLHRMPDITPLTVSLHVIHGWHLFVVKVPGDRNILFTKLRESGIGVNVHYLPVYLHPFYQKTFGYAAGLCPVAEQNYKKILTLPLYPGMNTTDCARVVKALETNK
ncbi:MAG: UDP-4-amino-4,6-dideoxy-N-acetyl-beta-L-altrosamine transaminase [Chthoniobacterales bacterium]